jgi:DNA-binding protein
MTSSIAIRCKNNAVVKTFSLFHELQSKFHTRVRLANVQGGKQQLQPESSVEGSCSAFELRLSKVGQGI